MSKEEFYQFYQQNIDSIFRFFYFRVNSSETARDLSAEAFLKFFQATEKNNSIKNPRAFLFQISRHLLVDFYRQRKPVVSLDELQEKGLEIAEDSFLEGLEKDEDLKTIQKALTKIRPLYSEVIIFYYFDNLPLKEIALILNKKENNIRVLLHRAMKALKEEVEKEEHPS